MTTTSNSEFDCADLVRSLLEWLDDQEDRDVSQGTVDEAFSVLASERRRRLLEVMQTHGEAITLPDAAEEVAVRESNDTRVQDLSAERVAEVYLSLYHDHLPRLTEAGLLEYDQERDLVSPTGIR